MKIISHRLQEDDGKPYPFVQSPNHGSTVTPEFLVMHYTAGSSAESSVSWLSNPAARASAHLVIGRDGSITQLVPFDTVAWHAGVSFWDGRQGLNRYSIGIELDNMGRLTRHGTKWRSWFGRSCPEEEVLEATHKNETQLCGWQLYTEPQLLAALDVATLLFQEYRLKGVVGHDDIAPGRKTDPGPAFPMSSFRARVMGRWEDEPVFHRTTTTLNIRRGPGTRHATVAGSPLPPGTRVEILASRGNWRQVHVLEAVNGVMDIEGWVHQRYLERIR